MNIYADSFPPQHQVWALAHSGDKRGVKFARACWKLWLMEGILLWRETDETESAVLLQQVDYMRAPDGMD